MIILTSYHWKKVTFLSTYSPSSWWCWFITIRGGFEIIFWGTKMHMLLRLKYNISSLPVQRVVLGRSPRGSSERGWWKQYCPSFNLPSSWSLQSLSKSWFPSCTFYQNLAWPMIWEQLFPMYGSDTVLGVLPDNLRRKKKSRGET